MAICRACGAQNADNAVNCARCGRSLAPQYNYQQQGSYQSPPQAQYYQASSAAPVKVVVSEVQLPKQYQPLSPWAYFGYSLLYSIPLIGLIMLIVFSFSDENINRRNHARSMFYIWIVVLILFAIIGAISGFSWFVFSNMF